MCISGTGRYNATHGNYYPSAPSNPQYPQNSQYPSNTQYLQNPQYPSNAQYPQNPQTLGVKTTYNNPNINPSNSFNSNNIFNRNNNPNQQQPSVLSYYTNDNNEFIPLANLPSAPNAYGNDALFNPDNLHRNVKPRIYAGDEPLNPYDANSVPLAPLPG